MESHRLLIFCAAGFGNPQRFHDLGVALHKALTQEIGREPTPVATSAYLDAYVFSVSSQASAVEFGNSFMKRLRKTVFEIGDADRSDKIVITELGDEKFFTTSAVMKTVLGWERGRMTK